MDTCVAVAVVAAASRGRPTMKVVASMGWSQREVGQLPRVVEALSYAASHPYRQLVAQLAVVVTTKLQTNSKEMRIDCPLLEGLELDPFVYQ